MTTSVYIHIPFCSHICNYCDFSKFYYNEDIVNKYLNALNKEIKLLYKGEYLKTIYIGGGSPSSLSVNNLKKLMSIISIFNLNKDYEFTIELNPEDINEEKLLVLKENKINRISIGIESTNDKFLKYLNRHHSFNLVKEKINLIKKMGFNNISVDLIYGMKNETVDDLKKDLDNIIELNVNHISTYSLEIHSNTIFGINKEKRIDDNLDRKMYDYICNYLKKYNYNHYEISNFCKGNLYSRHNMVYWNNDNYYGFGLSASGYIDNMRYSNTKSLNNYLNGNKIIYKEILSMKEMISYSLILGFRLINGINKNNFKKRYSIDIESLYNIKELIKKGYLINDKDNIKIYEEYLYVENSILENFIN